MKVIGSRKRKYFSVEGNVRTLVVRRLKCKNCGRVHHELPDFIVPYKRYDSECIENVVSGGKNLSVPADNSTIARWRRWFAENIHYFKKALTSVKLRINYHAEEKELSRIPSAALSGILHIVGNGAGWLARIVRTLANTNLWVHTRSAFLSTW